MNVDKKWTFLEPISTMGTDYGHHVTTYPYGFSDLPTGLRLTGVGSSLDGSKASKRVESQFEEKRSFIMGHDKMRCFLYLQATFILLGG